MGWSPAILLLTWLLSSILSAAISSTVALPPFNAVDVSLPFSVKIAAGQEYSFAVNADEQVFEAINSSVRNSVLYLETRGNFTTQQPISVTISMPADSLQHVLVRSPNNLVAVDTGFSVPAFIAQVAGTSTLYVRNLVAQQVSVTSTGTSSTYLSRSLGAVSLKGSGVSNFYLQGQAASLALDLSGVSNAASAIDSDDLQITGGVSFPGRISYTHGTCNLCAGGRKHRSFSQSNMLHAILGNTCEQVPSINIPMPDLTFTCGINVTEFSLASKGNNRRNGSNESGGDRSCSVIHGAPGVNGGDENGNDGTHGTGGLIIQSLECQSLAARNIFA